MKFNPAPKDPIVVNPLIQGWVSYILKEKDINNLEMEDITILSDCLFCDMAEQENSYGKTELYEAMEDLLYQIDYYYCGL